MSLKDTFFEAYIETALWSTTDESTESGGVPLDQNYDASDIAPEALAELRKDCDAFWDAHEEMLLGSPSHGGHDFWLTRNRHGAGFWDGDWPEDDGKVLTEASHAYGEVYLYVGDDGRIHV